NEIAAGVTITDERDKGLSGGNAASCGRCALPDGGSMFITAIAPPNEPGTTSAPMAIFPVSPMRPTPLNRSRILYDSRSGHQRDGRPGQPGQALTVFPGHLHRSAMMHFSQNGLRATQM